MKWERTVAVISCHVGGEENNVVPTIAGQAWITGVFQHGLDPSDPFRNGYTLPDPWFA